MSLSIFYFFLFHFLKDKIFRSWQPRGISHRGPVITGLSKRPRACLGGIDFEPLRLTSLRRYDKWATTERQTRVPLNRLLRAPMKSFQVLALLRKPPAAMYTEEASREAYQKADLLIHPAGLDCNELKPSPPQTRQREPYDIEWTTPSLVVCVNMYHERRTTWLRRDRWMDRLVFITLHLEPGSASRKFFTYQFAKCLSSMS